MFGIKGLKFHSFSPGKRVSEGIRKRSIESFTQVMIDKSTLGEFLSQLFLTGGVQSVNIINCLAVKHPEVSIVAGKKAGTTWNDHMITYNVPTETESKYN